MQNKSAQVQNPHAAVHSVQFLRNDMHRLTFRIHKMGLQTDKVSCKTLFYF